MINHVDWPVKGIDICLNNIGRGKGAVFYFQLYGSTIYRKTKGHFIGIRYLCRAANIYIVITQEFWA